MIYAPISQFRKDLLEYSQTKNETVVIVRNSKPVGVYISFEEWQKIQLLLQSTISKSSLNKASVESFWSNTNTKLKKIKAKPGKVLTQDEIDNLSYVS
jgi:PHD/YefM family antitoxin component YafN of YafNO toxin-antitoxin module